MPPKRFWENEMPTAPIITASATSHLSSEVDWRTTSWWRTNLQVCSPPWTLASLWTQCGQDQIFHLNRVDQEKWQDCFISRIWRVWRRNFSKCRSWSTLQTTRTRNLQFRGRACSRRLKNLAGWPSSLTQKHRTDQRTEYCCSATRRKIHSFQFSLQGSAKLPWI